MKLKILAAILILLLLCACGQTINDKPLNSADAAPTTTLEPADEPAVSEDTAPEATEAAAEVSGAVTEASETTAEASEDVGNDNDYESDDEPEETSAPVNKDSSDSEKAETVKSDDKGKNRSLVSGTVTQGSWADDNYAGYMLGQFIDDRYRKALDKLALAVQNLEPTVDLGEYLSHDECVGLSTNIAQIVGTTYCYFNQVASINNTRLVLDYYAYSPDEAKSMMNELNSAGDEVVRACSTYSEYDKVKYIYEWIIKNSRYDSCDFCASAYGPIIDKCGTCMGYAKATFYLLSKAGFDCIYSVGHGLNDSHIWVKANIGGRWYNIDTGWGDPVSPTEKDPGYVCYDYLCVTDDYIANTRTSVFDMSGYYSTPSADSEDLNWYILNNCYAESFEEATAILKDETAKAIKDEKSSYVYVRIQMSNMSLFNEVAEHYTRQVYQDEILAPITDKRIANSKLSSENNAVKKSRTIVFRLRKK